MMGVYIYRFTVHLPWSDWIAPIQTRPSQDLSATNRPRIELHPEDHVYRQPVTHHLDWRITSGQRRPDGVLKKIYLINGVLPNICICLKSMTLIRLI
jgi:hypothetical protein